MLLSVNIVSMHAHSKTLSFSSEGEETNRITWVTCFHDFIIQRKNRFPFIWKIEPPGDGATFYRRRVVFSKSTFGNNEEKTPRFLIRLFFFSKRWESWFSDQHSLGDEQDAALRSLPVPPHGRPFPAGFQEVLHVQRGNSSRNCTVCKQQRSQWSGPRSCIISIESAAPKAWGPPSPGARRGRGRATCPRPVLPLARRSGRLRPPASPWKRTRTLWCSRRSSRCRCPSCCPRHLQQEKHRNQTLHSHNDITSFYGEVTWMNGAVVSTERSFM